MPETEVNARPVVPTPPRKTWNVTEFVLRLDALLLQDMELGGVHIDVDPMPAAKLECDSVLVPGSRGDTSFEVRLKWQVIFDGDEEKPFDLSGCHLLKFGHKKDLSEEGASYYAIVNSFVFAYPYLRQIVNEIASWTVGKALILEPLDVPAYVLKQVRVFRSQTAQDTPPQGAQNAQDVQCDDAGDQD